MDQWLTWCFLEGGGGGQGKESYELALYFLAQHTEMDCWVKRKKRGYLFMTGDELPYPALSKHIVEAVIGDRLDDDLKVEEVVAESQKTFVPFFIIPDQERRERCERRWRDLLGDHVLCMDGPEDVCFVTAGAIALSEGLVPGPGRAGEACWRARACREADRLEHARADAAGRGAGAQRPSGRRAPGATPGGS